MNKKGMEERLYFWIFYFVVLIIILLGLFTYVNNLAGKITFDQDYLARDLALVLNTVYASPGNIEVSYSIPKKNDFLFIIEDGLVIVRQGNDVLNERSYPFQEDTYVESNLGDGLKLNDPAVILFSKKDNVLEISGVSRYAGEMEL